MLDREARKLLWTPGPWISLGMFLLLLAPYLAYLYLSDGYNPLDRLGGGKWGAGEIILRSAQNHWLMFVILALTGFLWKGAFSWSRPLTRDDRFLLVFALLPLLLVFLVGSMIGQKYIFNWFWPFFTLTGFARDAVLRRTRNPRALSSGYLC